MIEFLTLTTKHLPSVRQIYNWYVANTTVSFDIDPASIEKMEKLTLHQDIRFVSFAIVESNSVIGYVMLSPFIQKHASFRSAEVSIYLAPGYEGKGIGKQALLFIEKQAIEQGFHTLIAVICSENDASLAAFERHGYKLQGMIEQVAYKFDRYLSVSYYQKLLH